MSNNYPRLEEMGIKNPHEIEKYAVYTVGNTDILRIIYDRKLGALLPVSRRYKFPQAKRSVMVDSGTDTAQVVYESIGAFREALNELEQLNAEQQKVAGCRCPDPRGIAPPRGRHCAAHELHQHARRSTVIRIKYLLPWDRHNIRREIAQGVLLLLASCI